MSFYLIYLAISDGQEGIFGYSLSLLLVIIIHFICLRLERLFVHKVAYQYIRDLRIATLEKIEKLPFEIVEKQSRGHMLRLILDRSEQLENIIAHQMPQALYAIMMPLISAVLLIGIDWRFAILAMLPLPIALYIQLRKNPQLFIVGERYASISTTMQERNVDFTESLTYLQSFRVRGKELDALQQSYTNYRTVWQEMSRVKIPRFILYVTIVEGALLSFIPASVGWDVTVTLFYVVFILGLNISIPFRQFASFGHQFTEAKQIQLEIQQWLQQPDMIFGSSNTMMKCDLTLADVGYTFDESTQIGPVNFSTKANNFVVLKGKSGNGKSTILKILAGRYQGTGTYEIDGVPMKAYSEQALRNGIWFVPQTSQFFHETLLFNLTLGKMVSEHTLQHVLKIVELSERVSTLPEGLKTYMNDSKVNFSGGELQRIALARAILQDVPLILLDEATAAIDEAMELRIIDQFKQLPHTFISIAHRQQHIHQANLQIQIGREV
ncbi:ATP-binding cassette domain-containing protein [Lysinibacillus sphaericus]|uniref:ATP-binding cassette domain-containing protein n=1 Tax=Lysinibacillus sphaericus TaxID=1421 RepID=UPI00163BCAA1|nr:ABC transporter ATP-binding protein [Lysinibacillus sp. SDF0037]